MGGTNYNCTKCGKQFFWQAGHTTAVELYKWDIKYCPYCGKKLTIDDLNTSEKRSINLDIDKNILEGETYGNK